MQGGETMAHQLDLDFIRELLFLIDDLRNPTRVERELPDWVLTDEQRLHGQITLACKYHWLELPPCGQAVNLDTLKLSCEGMYFLEKTQDDVEWAHACKYSENTIGAVSLSGVNAYYANSVAARKRICNLL